MRSTLTALALLLHCSIANADSILTKTGERFVGKIISEEPGKVIFQSESVGRIEIPRERIERVEAQGAEHVETAPLLAPIPLFTNAYAPWMAARAINESNRFDWIELKSGEWLKGRIKSMQDYKLEFDSEEMDNRTFDWEDIHTVRSPRLHGLLFDTGEPVFGSILITTNEVEVSSSIATNKFLRKELIAITPTGRREIDKWSAHVSVGMSLRTGNTREVDYNAHATLQRRTPSTRLMFDYLGNYGRINGVETEDNHRAYGQFDYFLSRRLFLRIPTIEYYQDPLLNLDRRVTVAGGLGYDLIHNRRVEYNISAGLGWQRNWYSSVETNQMSSADSAALIIGTRLEVELTERLDFILEYRGQFTGGDTGGNTHHALATFEFEIHKRLNFDVSFIWDRVANPATDASGHTPSRDDVRLNVGLGLDY